MRLASIIFPLLPCALAMCVQSVVRSRFLLSFGESVVPSFSLGSWSRIVPFFVSFEAVSYRRWGFVIVRVGESSFRSCSSRYRVYPLSPLNCSFVRSVSC